MTLQLIFLTISLLLQTFGTCNIPSTSNKLIDLTWPFDNRTIYWPGSLNFHFTKQIHNCDRGFWYSSNEFCAGEHGGTHFDAPYHFHKTGWTVDQIPLDRLLAKGALIDLQSETEQKGANTTLTVEHLQRWEKDNGPFEEGTVLLVKFGWGKFWGDKSKYLGEAEGKLNFPGLSEEACNWIVNSGKFYGVGLDTASVDPGSSSDFMAHRILYPNGIYGLENVKLMERIPAKGFRVLVMPMLIGGGTGGPLRIAALLD